jgi:hypothetical protein
MSRYYWPGMFRDIKKYVRTCDSCQRYKINQQAPAGEMLTKIPEEPYATLCADFIGPLPRSTHGNTMILVFFDQFSKWAELVPLRKATSLTTIKAFRERILSRYGTPKVMLTDNGSQFISRTFQKFLKEMGIKQQFTAPYSPQETPTERANRTIKTIVAQVTQNQHNKWDEHLPEIMLALNTSVSSTTGYSAAFLTQGREPRLPAALYDEVTLGTGNIEHNTDDWARTLHNIFDIVRINLSRASKDQARHYNLRRRRWTPEIGQKVLIKNHALSKAADNFNAKLAPKFIGPYIITGFKSPVIALVRKPGRPALQSVHISEIKTYFPDTR